MVLNWRGVERWGWGRGESSLGTFGVVWRYFSLSGLRLCHWHLVGEARAAVEPSVHRASLPLHTAKHYPARNVPSAMDTPSTFPQTKSLRPREGPAGAGENATVPTSHATPFKVTQMFHLKG